MVCMSLLTSVASAFYFFAKFGVSSGTVENDPCRHIYCSYSDEVKLYWCQLSVDDVCGLRVDDVY